MKNSCLPDELVDAFCTWSSKQLAIHIRGFAFSEFTQMAALQTTRHLTLPVLYRPSEPLQTANSFLINFCCTAQAGPGVAMVLLPVLCWTSGSTTAGSSCL